MSLLHIFVVSSKLINTNRMGAIYTFYILSIVLLFFCFSKIKEIDLEERSKDGHKRIYLGRMKKFFITEAKERDYIPKKTFILELFGYGCFLNTIVLASISWMLEVYFISALSWFWFLLIIIYTGIINLVRIKTVRPKKMIDY